MKKIRINELARELEVKPGVILELLPELGVQEKKTHSSSIDEDVALALRHRLTGSDAPRHAFTEGYNGHGHDPSDGHESSSVAVAEPPASMPLPEPAQTRTPLHPPVHEIAPEVITPLPGPAATAVPPSTPAQPPESAEAAAVSTPSVAPEPTGVSEVTRPTPFKPLRPPLGGGSALHPPLAHATQTPGGGPGNRNVSIPARPVPPPAPRVGSPVSSPAREARSADVSAPVVPPAPQPRGPQAPSHVVAPGPAPAAHGSGVPGAPIPPRPAPARPSAPGLTPGTPIAPRPASARPLAGQPAARPVVPPRPDLVQRLKQQQTQTRPSPAAPGLPRPGTPARPPSGPGQPLYRGPIRPGQPLMRGPGAPAQPGQRRPGGLRPMHPTTPLRPEPATLPTDQQRRHQAKPGTRQVARKRDEIEGVIRERVSKRAAVLE